MKLRDNIIFFISINIWGIYLLYTLVSTIIQFNNVHHIKWSQAENHSKFYSSLRSTTKTYSFVKDNKRISRKYPGIWEGVHTWFWGINKDARTVDISFYVFDDDFKDVSNKQIKYRKDVFGGKLNELESIPFMGLRDVNKKPSNISLFLDIWKYKYEWWVFIPFMLLPHFLILIIKKLKINILTSSDKSGKISKINHYLFVFLIIITITNFLA